jgi:hypothetical protein
MLHGRSAISFLKGQCRRHRMGRLVIGVQAEQFLQERQRVGASGLEFKLRSRLKR